MNTKSINRFFLKLQTYMFSLLVLGTVVSILYQITGQSLDWRTIGHQFLEYSTTIYLPIALILLILHLLILRVKQLQLYLYYNVSIKRFFGLLKHLTVGCSKGYVLKFLTCTLDRFFNDYYDSLILDSWTPVSDVEHYWKWVQQRSYKNKPVFIRREDLMAKNFWPNWAFSIVVLFNKLRITRHRNKNNSDKFRLEIDLRNQSYGIYNNAGKIFMTNKFLREGINIGRYIKQAEKVENFLKGEGPSDEMAVDAVDTPLRWAAGGVLPITHWRGKYWYVLFFRGISPVGWNVANGASETEEEYKNLHRLMVREFSEELVLLNREPQIDDPSSVAQKTFRLSDRIFDELPDKVKDEIISKKFIEKHASLRKNHDNLTIVYTEGPILEVIRTPFEIEITYHNKDLKGSLTTSVKDVIFSVNPLEFGIESTSLYAFEMDDDDYLVFGESWEVADCLLREPVLLLSCEYVQEVFEKNEGTLGKHVMESPCLDCKSLEIISSGKYYIFDKDIVFRKRRRDHITKEKGRTSETKKLELELHQRWLENYENLFKDLQKGKGGMEKNKHRPALVLCPVTWKTLESVCRYDILKNLSR